MSASQVLGFERTPVGLTRGVTNTVDVGLIDEVVGTPVGLTRGVTNTVDVGLIDEVAVVDWVGGDINGERSVVQLVLSRMI